MQTKSKIYKLTTLFLLTFLATNSVFAGNWTKTNHNAWSDAARSLCEKNTDVRCDVSRQRYKVDAYATSFSKMRCSCINR